jgi:predicted transcriptional regulator
MTTNTATREKTIVSAQFPRELKARLDELAREHDRSVSWEIRQAVAARLEQREIGSGQAADA